MTFPWKVDVAVAFGPPTKSGPFEAKTPPNLIVGVVVPMPTMPPLLIVKRDDVAPLADVEPIANADLFPEVLAR